MIELVGSKSSPPFTRKDGTMPSKPGKSAAGKGSPKSGYLLPGSNKTPTTSGTGAPKSSSGMIRQPKKGKG